MSTVHHHHAPLDLVWYAVAALLAAAVAVLAVTVLTNGTPSPDTHTVPVPPASGVAPRWNPGPACFAARPGADAELSGVCPHHAR